MAGRTSDWKEELERFLKPFLAQLGHKARRQMCPVYVAGLIGPGDRKSIQPMAQRLAAGDYDQLHHFIAAGIWDAKPVETELLVQADKLVGGSDAVLSLQVSLPSRIHPDISFWNSGKRLKWFATMKPSSRRLLPTANIRLRGPTGSPATLYCEIIPQRAKRAKRFAAVSAASRCSPPTLSKYMSIPLGATCSRASVRLPVVL